MGPISAANTPMDWPRRQARRQKFPSSLSERPGPVAMETAAVLRVKRKRGGSLPAEALVLASKRFRSEAGAAAEAASSPGEGEVEKTLFKLVATVSSEAEPVDKYVQEAFTHQKGGQILRPALGSAQRIIQDLRSSKHAKRQESRYRLITSLRPNISNGANAALGANEKESDEKKQSSVSEKEKNDSTSGCYRDFQFFDIIQEEQVENDTSASHLQKSDPDVILCNAVEMIRERLTVSDNSKEAEDCLNKEEYVYDIYCTETATPGWIENILSVQPYTQEFDLMDEEHFTEETYDDEDDENNENNWRNDYPDEDEFFDEESEKKSGDTSDEDCGYIRRSWEEYESEVLQEFDYDGVKELDSE
ncbi:probable RNA polymerase II nuclear localization protein SLC7A6OS isoform X2 [Thamnophis elegans]|uniref:probable RNA polymerase II nuclear localization protein SLC7A6OS isoform X2 n=1 Tax=Thamnophis elegans TaxID=35005 RepID=UPI001378A0DC|nr:probable RNA polymerase II nuclear localization protein SLC7A6OS isoform X2 [Thamnophis elegans]